MAKRLAGFEERIEADEEEKHIGKWVSITNKAGSQNFLGFVTSTEEGSYILNPSYGSNYVGGELKYGLFERDERIPFDICGPIEYTTRKNIEGLAEYRNKELEKQNGSGQKNQAQ